MVYWMLVECCFLAVFFFFKQKTAYEMRISDWSSDVCSSDLAVFTAALATTPFASAGHDSSYDAAVAGYREAWSTMTDRGIPVITVVEIGRASCRERVCQYV